MLRKVTTHWKGNMLFESESPNGKTVLMDTSTEDGGQDVGHSPKAIMLSALAGCSGLDIIMILDKMKVKISNLRMDTTGELTDEHPKYFHTVTIDYHFYGEDLNEKKIKKAVDLSIEKYCGVMEMFRKFSEVKTNIYYHDS